LTNPSKPSKKHHYVPKVILKRFYHSGSSLYYCERNTPRKGVQNRNIESVFRRTNYNSLEYDDGSKDDRLEKFFAHKLDNFIPEWTGVFERALKSGRVEFPSLQSRHRFIQFFYCHAKRTPDFLDPLVQDVANETFSEKGIAELETRLRRLSISEQMLVRSPDFQNRTLRNARVENLSRQSEEVLSRLMGMKVIVASPARRNQSFLVGSKPVVRFEDYPFQELGEEGVEMWTTFAPNLAVEFVAGPTPSDCMLLDSKMVRQLNTTLAKNSRAIASHSRELLTSISKAKWTDF